MALLFPVGTIVYFVKADNSIVTRTITGNQPLAAGYLVDSTVLLLDSDLPAEIAIYKTLPANGWTVKLPTNNDYYLPAVAFNQDKTVTTRKARQDQSNGNKVILTPYSSGDDSSLYSKTSNSIGGDSSSPVFLLVGNTPVLLGTWSSATYVTDISQHITLLNNTMTALGSGYISSQIDLSSYTSF